MLLADTSAVNGYTMLYPTMKRKKSAPNSQVSGYGASKYAIRYRRFENVGSLNRTEHVLPHDTNNRGYEGPTSAVA